MILNIKYRLSDLPGIVITQNREIWQEPFTSGKCSYGWREIKPHLHMGIIHYRINKKRYSKRKLNQMAYLSAEKIQINMLPKDKMPFN